MVLGPHEMAKRGRKTNFQPEFCQKAYEFALLGATDEEIADALGISTTSFYEYKNQFPEFAEAIKDGKKPADAKVATALYNRATGAEWTEQQAIKVKTVDYDNGKRVREEERVEVVEVKRAAPPDTTAIIFFLKNRRKDDWRDKQDVTVQHNTMDEIGDDELRARIEQLDRRIAELDAAAGRAVRRDGPSQDGE